VRRTAVLEGEHVVAWVIGGAEQFPFAVLPLALSAQRGKGGPVNRNRFVGVASFATSLVPRVATDDYPIVVDGDLTGIEVDPRPLKTTDLTPSDASSEFEQKEGGESISLHRH
jgi:hypothetical protein